ncbi:hypothetical protein E2K93_16455 [Thalassotalea sp. HSM 43]|uniref:hypothetical protein n=1 Tax=Thalassotalea sp. HSM 43 TaxID=2552945 RepID=UPI00107FE019|nr:hypothetical protein [Thalassotalea sp. HSM 43]QBY05858.1 hypothetical protein E2K93_16455 [Thalassotalea sp. HSM 43]
MKKLITTSVTIAALSGCVSTDNQTATRDVAGKSDVVEIQNTGTQIQAGAVICAYGYKGTTFYKPSRNSHCDKWMEVRRDAH